jgi:hypothetical protein
MAFAIEFMCIFVSAEDCLVKERYRSKKKKDFLEASAVSLKLQTRFQSDHRSGFDGLIEIAGAASCSTS